MERSCARPGCTAAASATLSYDYSASTAWLDHVLADPHPASHDLCASHADALKVPRGWSLQDRRGTLPHMFVRDDGRRDPLAS